MAKCYDNRRRSSRGRSAKNTVENSNLNFELKSWIKLDLMHWNTLNGVKSKEFCSNAAITHLKTKKSGLQ